tara:strand:+ start:1411 stop:2454 length:1044 start_codon:yes stop_codon:yes gene_type:complete
MANKSVYQNYDADALNHFDLASTPLYGVVAGSIVEDVLVTPDKTTYEEIERILSVPNESDITFKTKKKAFILPKCSVSQDRLKAALKEHGITVTNDYTLADLIIGHEDISHNYENGENILSTIMMCKLWNYETTNGNTSSGTAMQVLLSNHSNPVIVTQKITEAIRYYDLDISTNLYDSWMITGMALNLAYKIHSGLAGVIDPETVLHSSANKMIMDESLLKDLKTQLNAYGDDRALALKIIPTIDYTKNYHLLWQFAQDCGMITYADNRDKDLKYWIKISNFNSFERKSAQDMILWLENRDKLCTTTFRYLEPIVRRQISINNRDLYTFKVAVKKEYQQYLIKEKI